MNRTAPPTVAGRFVVTYQMHPLNVSDPLDQRYIRVTSTGTYGNSTRALWMDFKVDKKVKFAIVGKVPIQLGRNTLVEGPIGMATPNKYPPIYMLSDFTHLTTALTNKINAFNTFLSTTIQCVIRTSAIWRGVDAVSTADSTLTCLIIKLATRSFVIVGQKKNYGNTRAIQIDGREI